MSESTGISWTDHTWSPVWGCQQISPACDNCYAKTLAHRFGTGWNGAPYREFGDHHWNEPVRWNRRAAAASTRPRVFPSMCDPLDKDWPDGVRDRFWRLVDATPYLTWLMLAKRIGNVDRLGPAAILGRWPANVWLGSTVVNQEEADRDIPKLLATPAAVRFLSIEPMLSSIDLRPHLWKCCGNPIPGHPGDGWMQPPDPPECCGEREPVDRLSWVISGGESGPHARPAHPDWFRSLRDQCSAAGISFTFKQWGEWTPGENVERTRGTVETAFLDDDTWRIYPLNLATDNGHIDDQPDLYRVGKKAAGRHLDGVIHEDFPKPAA